MKKQYNLEHNMSGNKRPFLWNFIQNTQHRYQTGAEEGFSKSANEEMNSSITNFLTAAEEGLTESANEEIKSNIVNLHYNKKSEFNGF